MCVATGLAYSFVTAAYLQEAIVFNETIQSQETNDAAKNTVMIDFFVFLGWTAECSVKMSLLIFFRALVMRLQRLNLYVHAIMGITAVAWVVIVCADFISCPHFVSTSSELPGNLVTAIPLSIGVLQLSALPKIHVSKSSLRLLCQSSASALIY